MEMGLIHYLEKVSGVVAYLRVIIPPARLTNFHKAAIFTITAVILSILTTIPPPAWGGGETRKNEDSLLHKRAISSVTNIIRLKGKSLPVTGRGGP
jgi:hypothetical protein